MRHVWAVFQWCEDRLPESQGVFSSLERAVAACRTDLYYIVRFALDEELPHESVQGCCWTWYPHREPQPPFPEEIG